MRGINDTVTLFETKRHEISLSRFHLLAAEFPRIRTKWSSFSKQTKENIYLYFQYTRGLENEFDNNYNDYDYWKKWFIDFVNRFDEAKPRYSDAFEKYVLQNKVLMDELRQ